MITINLLPHREQKRAARQRRFISLLLMTLLVAAGIVVLGMFYLDGRLQNQNERNQYLTEQNQALDKQIAEIKQLKEQKDSLLARKVVVETLQNNRTEGVRLLDQLTRQTPEGIYLTRVTQAGQALTIVGQTQSNARVSTFMQNLEASPLFDLPQLVVVRGSSSAQSEFTLTVGISRNVAPLASEVAEASPVAAVPAPTASGVK